MNKSILFFAILIILNSCGNNSKPESNKELFEKNDVNTIDLSKSDLRLKIGPTWYENESKIHFVYGVSEKDISDNYITELHFNFGGNTNCQEKALLAIFDLSLIHI